jgi:hypothetical protein
MTKDWKTKIVNTKGFGAGTRRELREAALRRGRVIVAVKPESSRDTRPFDFAYTVPKPGINEPVLLASYPSQKTLEFLLNAVGDHFRENGWADLGTDLVELNGFLGEKGEIPIEVRLLSAEEHARACKRLTCQADPSLPVVLLSIPDPQGSRPQSPFCQSEVTRADLYLYTRLTEDNIDPETLWELTETMRSNQMREALIEHSDTVESLRTFTYWWETLSLLDKDAAVSIMSASPTLSSLYAQYAEANSPATE